MIENGCCANILAGKPRLGQCCVAELEDAVFGLVAQPVEDQLAVIGQRGVDLGFRQLDDRAAFGVRDFVQFLDRVGFATGRHEGAKSNPSRRPVTSRSLICWSIPARNCWNSRSDPA